HRPAAGGVPLVMRQVQVANLAALDLPGRRLHVHRSRDYSGKPGRNDEAASTVSLEVSSRVPRARATDLRTLPLGTSRTRNYAELRKLTHDRASSVVLIPSDCWLHSLSVDCSQRNGQRP